MSATLSHNPLPNDLDDAKAEFRALVSGCGVYDASARLRIAVTGKDRTRWLNGMITNNIRDLAAGRGVYGFLLNPQGQIQGDLYAYNRGESLLLEIDPAQQEKVLRHPTPPHHKLDKVELADVESGQTRAIAGSSGPRSGEHAGLPDLRFLNWPRCNLPRGCGRRRQ